MFTQEKKYGLELEYGGRGLEGGMSDAHALFQGIGDDLGLDCMWGLLE